MDDKFYDGMENVNEELNRMDRAFAAGPYNALPLTGGTLTGEVASSSALYVGSPGNPFVSNALFSPFVGADPAVGQRLQVAGFAVRGIPNVAHNGQWQVLTSCGPSPLREDHTLSLVASDQNSGVSGVTPLKIRGNGDVAVGSSLLVNGLLLAGLANTEPQGLLKVSVANSADFYVSAGPRGSSAASAVNITSNSVTGRSLNSPGTLNGGGADYAEYLIKGLLCGTVAPGQIVGIDADGHLTDKWDLAISFAVKSTNPCMVGGDSWAAHLGPGPAEPVRQDDDTDQQWAGKLAAAQVAQREFDAALELARQTVDRIAFAGQVPVNLHSATPGQFIVPVQDGDGIGGMAVDEADITLHQYMRAIGRVIAIEDDGRARIIVKVV